MIADFSPCALPAALQFPSLPLSIGRDLPLIEGYRSSGSGLGRPKLRLNRGLIQMTKPGFEPLHSSPGRSQHNNPPQAMQ